MRPLSALPACAVLLLASASSSAQTTPTSATPAATSTETPGGTAPSEIAGGGNQVVASGMVPDEATKAAIIGKLRAVYGADRVVDQITVANVVAPAEWSSYVQKLIGPQLRLVSHGELQVDGSTVTVQGEIANEAQRQQLLSDMATSLNTTYTVKNALHVAVAPPSQNLLDEALANRTVEFESGRSVLTPGGRVVLDQMAAALLKLNGQKVAIVGYTSDDGSRKLNVALSIARAVAVREYFVSKGIDGSTLTTAGFGPDHPIASNATPEGKARNRRIEFKVLN